MACLSSSRKYLAEVLLIGLTPRVEGDAHVLPLNFWESKEEKKRLSYLSSSRSSPTDH